MCVITGITGGPSSFHLSWYGWMHAGRHNLRHIFQTTFQTERFWWEWWKRQEAGRQSNHACHGHGARDRGDSLFSVPPPAPTTPPPSRHTHTVKPSILVIRLASGASLLAGSPSRSHPLAPPDDSVSLPRLSLGRFRWMIDLPFRLPGGRSVTTDSLAQSARNDCPSHARSPGEEPREPNDCTVTSGGPLPVPVMTAPVTSAVPGPGGSV